MPAGSLTARTAQYYADVTSSYLKYGKYGRELYGWHYGLWQDGVRTHAQALMQSSRRLLRGLDIRAGTRILDVGCGVGSFAVWAATTFGCRVTGMSIVPEHLEMAGQLAQRRGVADLCHFVTMDLMSLGFQEVSFDVIVNQDTFCYAVDQRGYLQRLWDLLVPGGHWRAQEFSIQEDPLSSVEHHLYRAVRDGFYIPRLAPPSEVMAILTAVGFEGCSAEDVTALVCPTARLIIRQCYLPAFACWLGLDWLLYSRNRRKRENFRGHIRAGVAYSRGLLQGCFRHYVYSARKPSAMTRLG